jgi:hypothetical protein
MRPVATQSRFTTPWLGNVFWLIQLLRPFGSGFQLFQAFGPGVRRFQAFGSGIQCFQAFDSGIQLFQSLGSGSQLFQPFGSGSGSAISLSPLCHGSEMNWM